MDTYFETDYLKISWNYQLQAVSSEWHGYSGGSTGKVQTGYTKVAELAAKYKSKKWLSDIRNLRVIALADQEWIAQTGHSLLVKAGIRYVGIVLPQSAVATLSLHRVLSQVGAINLEFGSYETIVETEMWLNSKK